MRMLAAALCGIFFAPVFAHAQFGGLLDIASDAPELMDIDIAIEADTFIPAFYEGRREPSPGSSVRAVAVISGTDSAAYRYRWEVDGAILNEDGNVAYFTAPFRNEFRLRVDAFNSAGERVASQEEYITASEPSVAFYADNLLHGTAKTAISRTYTLLGEEISIRAVPYFMDADIFAGGIELSWHVDGEEVTGLAEDEDVITLRNTGGSGTIPIEFMLRNLNSLTQYVEGKFSLTF